jgi:CheY-like chemotaxis protein
MSNREPKTTIAELVYARSAWKERSKALSQRTSESGLYVPFDHIAVTFHWDQDRDVRRFVSEADKLSTMSPSSARSIRAVVIEDNAADVYLIREALKQEFAEVELEVLDNGEAASRFMDRFTNESLQRPDIILLDLNLPRFDGKQVLQRFRQMPDGRKVPVVIITSSNSPKDREDCLTLGATFYFRKPSELDEFMKIAGVIKDLVRPA